MPRNHLSWLSIVRLGLVQTALGAIVVLTTSTLNRVMVVEMALPAMIPGALVTLHHAMQLLRPRMGHGSDLGHRRTPWIIGGMGVLALGGLGAAVATTLFKASFGLALALAIASFAAIGAGVSACGTSLLVLMAKQVAPERRGAAATLVWMMMIAGFAVTATLAGKQLEPFSASRLIAVAAGISVISVLVSVLAIWGVEGEDPPVSEPEEKKLPFLEALKQVWREPDARRFTLFVFVSMLAYSAQDLILEPFAGAIFAFSPGASTKLSGVQHAGVFSGMALVAVMTSLFKRDPARALKRWVLSGCVASGVAMSGLVWAGLDHPGWPLTQNVFLLGLANGVFSIAAIGGMMTLASQGGSGREGVRMGLWGAAQAIAFGSGGFLGTALSDLARLFVSAPGRAYAFVFALEVVGFFAAYVLATGVRFSSSVDEAVAPAVVEPRAA